MLDEPLMIVASVAEIVQTPSGKSGNFRFRDYVKSVDSYAMNRLLSFLTNSSSFELEVVS